MISIFIDFFVAVQLCTTNSHITEMPDYMALNGSIWRAEMLLWLDSHFFLVGLHKRDIASIGLAQLVISPSGKIEFPWNNVQLGSNRKVWSSENCTINARVCLHKPFSMQPSCTRWMLWVGMVLNSALFQMQVCLMWWEEFFK